MTVFFNVNNYRGVIYHTIQLQKQDWMLGPDVETTLKSP